MKAKSDDRDPAWTETDSRAAIRESGVTPRFIASAPAPESNGAGSPKGKYLNTILNRYRLVQPAARIPQQLLYIFALATAAGGHVTAAQPAASVSRISTVFPAHSPVAAWCPICRLHNKERARHVNPIISANSPLAVATLIGLAAGRAAACSLRHGAPPRRSPHQNFQVQDPKYPEKAAAESIAISVKTLQRWRLVAKGPGEADRRRLQGSSELGAGCHANEG